MDSEDRGYKAVALHFGVQADTRRGGEALIARLTLCVSWLRASPSAGVILTI